MMMAKGLYSYTYFVFNINFFLDLANIKLSCLNFSRFAQTSENKHYTIELAERKKIEANLNEKGDYDPYLNRKVEHPTS